MDLPHPGDPEPSAICTGGFPYQRMSAILVGWLRTFYKDPGNTAIPFLREQHWRVTPTQDSMYIELASTWSPATALKRYSLVVSRSDITFNTISIGDRTHFSDDRDGRVIKSRVVAGQHVISVVGRDEAAVEDLAAEVEAIFTAFGLDLIRAYQLFSVKAVKLGAPARVKEHHDMIGVPVIMAWAAEKAYETIPQAPILANIATRFDG
jgi:hypothetical protein